MAKLEAAEKERDALRTELADLRSSMTFRTSLIGRIEAERDTLRTKIEAMEQQEPVAWMDRNGTLYNTVSHVRASDKPLYLAPGAQPAPSVPDDMIEQAVTRFLSWKLPKDFHPDGGVVFIPTKGRGYDSPHWPCGTNLLNAQQARDMLRHVLAAAPEAKP